MTQPCARDGQTCLQRLAAGWIRDPDLCPDCTRRFMIALDWVSGEPLAWHADYLARVSAFRPDPRPATPATTNGS